VSASSSGLFSDAPVSWPRRIEADAESTTSPEELLAAAHATCYSMGLSNRLAINGFPAERLDVTAEVTIAQPDQWPSVTESHITVRAEVAGIDEDTFADYAQKALETCPMSRALTGNVTLSVTAHLAR
jgi:osmotically inducible protein OsmC